MKSRAGWAFGDMTLLSYEETLVWLCFSFCLAPICLDSDSLTPLTMMTKQFNLVSSLF